MQFAIKLTIGVIIAVTALLIGYDIWAASNGVSNSLDTISGRLRAWAYVTPLIPWVWCGLSGHFFGPWHRNDLISAQASVGILVFLTWAVIWLGLVLRSKGIVIPPYTICIPAFFAGAILWAQ
jgi:hypothetical protein